MQARKLFIGAILSQQAVPKGHFTKVYSIKGVDLKICLGFLLGLGINVQTKKIRVF